MSTRLENSWIGELFICIIHVAAHYSWIFTILPHTEPHRDEPGMITVELDMVFPKEKYLQMIDEYVKCSLSEWSFLFCLK